MMASVSRILPKNLLPKPSPFEAPFTKPAISTISQVAGTMRPGCTNSANLVSRSSGTVITPTLGSIVQKGKFAAWAFALDKQLNKVDLPTLGSPTIPHFNDIFSYKRLYSGCKVSANRAKNQTFLSFSEMQPKFSKEKGTKKLRIKNNYIKEGRKHTFRP